MSRFRRLVTSCPAPGAPPPNAIPHATSHDHRHGHSRLWFRMLNLTNIRAVRAHSRRSGEWIPASETVRAYVGHRTRAIPTWSHIRRACERVHAEFRPERTGRGLPFLLPSGACRPTEGIVTAFVWLLPHRLAANEKVTIVVCAESVCAARSRLRAADPEAFCCIARDAAMAHVEAKPPNATAHPGDQVLYLSADIYIE